MQCGRLFFELPIKKIMNIQKLKKEKAKSDPGKQQLLIPPGYFHYSSRQKEFSEITGLQPNKLISKIILI
jgi:hypothetical protein